MKITQEHQVKALSLHRQLIERAQNNLEFKKQLIDNPRESISLVIGDNNVSIQNTKKIVVEDQTDDSIIYLNIPCQPDLEELALTEEQLEMVSGGSTWYCALVPVIVSYLLDEGSSDSGGDVKVNVQVGDCNSNSM